MNSSYRILALAIAAALLPLAASAATRVLVPDGTTAAVQLVDTVNSLTNHVGDIIEFRTINDVAVNGWVVVPAGAKGEGHVAKIDEAGGHGHPGTIVVVCDYITSADGGKLHLQNTQFSAVGKTSHGGATVAGIFTYGLASNAIRGGDAEIDSTRTLSALIQGPVHVFASKRAATSDGFDH